MPVVNVRQTRVYRCWVDVLLVKWQEQLREIGYDPDDPADRETCEWLAWHWEEDR